MAKIPEKLEWGVDKEQLSIWYYYEETYLNLCVNELKIFIRKNKKDDPINEDVYTDKIC